MKIAEVTQTIPAQPSARTAAVKPPIKLPAKVPPVSKPNELGTSMKAAGIPVLAPIEPPPMPQQAAAGEKIETLPNGNVKYSGGFGEYVYDKAGKPLTYTTPSFSGYMQIHDLVTGNITVRYVSGPLNLTSLFDKNGKSLDSEKVQYDLGLGVMGYEKDKGITAMTWQDRGNNVIQSRDMVKDPAAYDRAMAQVNRTTNEELDAVLKIAGLK